MKVCLGLLMIVAALPVLADSNGLNVSVTDAFLEISGKAAEPSAGGFNSPTWKLEVTDKFSNALDLTVSLGSTNLLYQPNWVMPSSGSLTLLDAKGTLRTSFADFYGGQFLVPFGLEGQREEKDLWFPRSLLYENGLLPLRDYGVGVTAQDQGFYFNIAAHSGKGGIVQTTPDNRAFVTGQWGYESPTHDSVGLSLTSGRILNGATETKLRGGNLFFTFHFFTLKFELEGSIFQSTTGSVDSNYLAWHGDFIYPLSDSINLLSRYEQYNPNTQINADVKGRGYIGLEWHNKNAFSRLFVFGVKNNESLTENPNDAILIAWRITPF